MEIEDEMLEADWVELQKREEGQRPFGETFGGTVVAIAGGFALALTISAYKVFHHES